MIYRRSETWFQKYITMVIYLESFNSKALKPSSDTPTPLIQKPPNNKPSQQVRRLHLHPQYKGQRLQKRQWAKGLRPRHQHQAVLPQGPHLETNWMGAVYLKYQLLVAGILPIFIWEVEFYPDTNRLGSVYLDTNWLVAVTLTLLETGVQTKRCPPNLEEKL